MKSLRPRNTVYTAFHGHSPDMARILITGAAGTCAKWLLLQDKNYRLTDVVPASNITKYIRGRHYYKGDLDNPDFCNSVTKDIDCIIHLAGASKLDSRPEKVVASNIRVTLNLLEASVVNKVNKFILASTNHIYGLFEENLQKKDVSDWDNYHSERADKGFLPDSVYATSKIFCEETLKLYCFRHHISGLALRIGTVVPPSEAGEPECSIEDYAKLAAVGPDSYTYDYARQRASKLLVPGGRFQSIINKAVSQTWSGFRAEAIDRSGQSWLQQFNYRMRIK